MPSMQTNSPYRGSGSISREQFLFYEMWTTARLIAQGMNDREVLEQIVTGNLFQYPTEKPYSRWCEPVCTGSMEWVIWTLFVLLRHKVRM